MSYFFVRLISILSQTFPYWGMFVVSFVIVYLLTPLVRELARKFGMVDVPSARRINKVPVPRGGGLAVFLGVVISLTLFISFSDVQISPLLPDKVFIELSILSTVLVVIGLIDDKRGLPPLVKLGGQLVVSAGVFFWCGLGLHVIPLFEFLPLWLDAVLTILWITGAINAFNLIDGLDGLATGLAFIASIGMIGALFFIGYPSATIPYLIFGGGCLAFLRYNFNPASVFLGDTGSMFLGFFLATCPLITKSADSLVFSLGVPLLTMGVPLFDTALAIIRRTLRAILKREMRGEESGNSHLMQADTDHIHHRFLRKFVSQKKAAFALYTAAAFLVFVAVCGVALRDKAAGLYAVAFIVAVYVITLNMRKIELWDAGRLLNMIAHDKKESHHSFISAYRLPVYLAVDILMLCAAFVLTVVTLRLGFDDFTLHVRFPIRISCVFFSLVAFRVYKIVWGRAVASNYATLLTAVFTGVIIPWVIFVLMGYPSPNALEVSCLYFLYSSFALCLLRMLRPVLRDYVYKLNKIHLIGVPGIQRILTYGAGLRYRMFRTEMVRSADKNKRVIIGILDDDRALHGSYVGGVKVYGTLEDAADVIKEFSIDAVVVTCKVSDEKLAEIAEILKPAGVKVSYWRCEESTLN